MILTFSLARVWDATGSPDGEFKILDRQRPVRARDLGDQAFEAVGTVVGTVLGPYGPVVKRAVVEGSTRTRKLLTNHDGALGFVKVVVRNPLSLRVGHHQTFAVQGMDISHGSDYSIRLTSDASRINNEEASVFGSDRLSCVQVTGAGGTFEC